jgi:hypothetical protein
MKDELHHANVLSLINKLAFSAAIRRFSSVLVL